VFRTEQYALMNEQLQNFARAAGAVYHGDGMGLHHFKELSTNSNFSLRIPPAASRECITSDKILVRAQEVRRSYGKPEPEAVTEAAKSLRVQCGNGNMVNGWYDRLSRNWIVQVKDDEETQIGDAEYSGSRGSFENSMQRLIDQNGGRVCETTGTASVGAGSTVTAEAVLKRACEVRKSYGEPEPVTEAASSFLPVHLAIRHLYPEPKWSQGNCATLAFGVYQYLQQAGKSASVWVNAAGDHAFAKCGRDTFDADPHSLQDTAPAANITQLTPDEIRTRYQMRVNLALAKRIARDLHDAVALGETTGTASVGAGSTARTRKRFDLARLRQRRDPEGLEDHDLPIDLIESIAEIPSTDDADEPSGYMLDGNDLIALQQTVSGEAADSEVQSWLEECGLIADGQVTPHGQRILDGNAAH